MDIYKHCNENVKKSTSCHAKIVCPEQVELITIDPRVDGCLSMLERKYPNPKRILLLYPDEKAKLVTDIDLDCYDKLIVVDGTWQQAKQMIRVFNKIEFQAVRIRNWKTKFWRHQQLGSEYLATIEAIYYFYKELGFTHDELLFYFQLTFDRIQLEYKSNPQKQFTSRKQEGKHYIIY